MYDKLCRQLRAMASTWGISLPREAADAIEELSRENKEIIFRANQLEAINEKLLKQLNEANLYADFYREHANKCLHYIHNEHDRGDDSLCTKWGCEVKALPKWISVMQRLPTISEKAICFGKNGYMIGTYSEFGWMFPCYFGKVTHWMQLPEPPESEDE